MTELMSSLKSRLNDLRRTRDELKLRAALAKADAKKAWEEIENKWPRVEESMKEIEQGGKDMVGGALHTVQALIGEIETGYKTLMKPGEDEKPMDRRL